MKYAEKLYSDLMALVATDDNTFYFKDFELNGSTVRIFNYRLASWTSFQTLPGALDCRGTTFDITEPNEPILVSLPPQKFFNYGEGNVVHDNCSVGSIMEKLDGSIISTLTLNGELYLKSKGSVNSEQRQWATAFVNKTPALKQFLVDCENVGYTVNMEYTAPWNRIVVGYQEETLRIFSIRDRFTGDLILPHELALAPQFSGDRDLRQHFVDTVVPAASIKPSEVNDECRSRLVGEGSVVQLINVMTGASYLIKCKADNYVLLHKQKDSINSARALFEAAARQTTDDLRSLFADDAFALGKISAMEDRVFPLLNGTQSTVEKFYEANQTLSRKDYALKAQAELNPSVMSLAMNLYIGRPNDYPGWLVSKYDLFRVPEDVDVVDTE